MAKKKALRSTRNRHTGVVNSFKQRVLDNKSPINQTDSKGTAYRSAPHQIKTYLSDELDEEGNRQVKPCEVTSTSVKVPAVI